MKTLIPLLLAVVLSACASEQRNPFELFLDAPDRALVYPGPNFTLFSD